jgi:hypothetical protein
MELSRQLGKIFGIYLVIVSIAIAIHIDQFILLVNAFITDKPLIFLSSFFTLILGIVLIVIHSVWEWSWRLLITIFSWIIFIKGICLLVYPQYLNSFTSVYAQNHDWLYSFAVINFIIGLILLYCGFKKA